MSVNKYNPTTGELTSLAGGTRTWIGTKTAYEAEKQAGTLPNDVLIVITDDEEELAQEVIEDDPRAVTSGAVYDALSDKISRNNVDDVGYFSATSGSQTSCTITFSSSLIGLTAVTFLFIAKKRDASSSASDGIGFLSIPQNSTNALLTKMYGLTNVTISAYNPTTKQLTINIPNYYNIRLIPLAR